MRVYTERNEIQEKKANTNVHRSSKIHDKICKVRRAAAAAPTAPAADVSKIYTKISDSFKMRTTAAFIFSSYEIFSKRKFNVTLLNMRRLELNLVFVAFFFLHFHFHSTVFILRVRTSMALRESDRRRKWNTFGDGATVNWHRLSETVPFKNINNNKKKMSKNIYFVSSCSLQQIKCVLCAAFERIPMSLTDIGEDMAIRVSWSGAGNRFECERINKEVLMIYESGFGRQLTSFLLILLLHLGKWLRRRT